MSEPGTANVDLEVAILEVGTAARGIKELALSVSQQESGVQAILFLVCQNVEALHDNLCRAHHGPGYDGLFGPGDKVRARPQEAVRAASVLGQRFSLQALHHLLGEPGYDYAALLEHRLVRPEGSDYLFAHALVRDGIYASLLRGPKQDLHGLAADFYVDRDAVLHAEHLDRASSPDAPHAYLAAAKEQAGQIRYENAFRLVGRALEITPAEESFALRLLEGELLRLLGSAAASINAYQGALEVAADGLERCRARIGIAEGLRLSEQHDELLQTLDLAEDDAGAEELLPERARIYQLRGSVYFTRGEPIANSGHWMSA